MNAIEMLTGPFAQAIGWALLHLLWQATIVAGILAAALALIPRENANVRYLTSCGALALVFAMFVATAARSYDPAAAPVRVTATADERVAVPLTKVPIVIVASAAASWRDRAVDAVTTARQSLPTVVAIWLLGVIVLSSRLLVSWTRARALVTRHSVEASAEWQQAAARISDALGLKRAVRLLESAAVEVPSVIGTLRPAILLPASALTGLTPQQIEMVLAHELAHIRRHDFLMNLLQAFVETLMFYHPAVWWMSRRVRIERENCCDDLAVAVCGSPLQYAKALTRLEELRAGALSVVVAANGGSLLQRIRRIAAGRAESTANSSRWAAAVAMLAILGVALALPSLPVLAQREKADAPAAGQMNVVGVAPAPRAAGAGEAQPAPAPVAQEDEADSDYEGDPESEPDADYDYDYEAPELPELADVPAAPESPAVPGWVEPAYAPAPPHAPSVPAVALAPIPAITAAPAPRMAFFSSDDDDDEDERERERQRDREHDRRADERRDRGERSDGRLEIDDLIALRATGATPEYIQQMRSVFPNARLKDIASMSALGVSADYVRSMREAGIKIDRPNDIVSLSAVGVTAAYVKGMRDAGFTIDSADDVTGMRAVGVTPEFVREMRDAGVTIRRASDITGLAAVGVTGEYVRAMRDAGVNISKLSDLTGMRAVGVTPEFVRKLAAAGYTNLSARDLTNMAAHGIDGDFIREMSKYRDDPKKNK